MTTLDYIGRPWQRGGFDCWALVREFYSRELSVELEPVTNIDNENLKDVFSEFESSEIFSRFEKVAIPKNFDVVGMFFEGTKRLGHVGIYLEESRSILHCSHNSDSCVQHIGIFERLNLIQGYYRYRV